MAISLGSTKGLSASINMTPMIDVLLVLIIIFMVIQTVPHGLEAVVPQPSSKGGSPAKTLVVQIDADGTLKINQEPVTLDALGGRLAEIFKTRADKTCFVKASRTLDFGDVAHVIDAMKSAGADRVGLM
jgi:biopolymer transport protein TolR